MDKGLSGTDICFLCFVIIRLGKYTLKIIDSVRMDMTYQYLGSDWLTHGNANQPELSMRKLGQLKVLIHSELLPCDVPTYLSTSKNSIILLFYPLVTIISNICNWKSIVSAFYIISTFFHQDSQARFENSTISTCCWLIDRGNWHVTTWLSSPNLVKTHGHCQNWSTPSSSCVTIIVFHRSSSAVSSWSPTFQVSKEIQSRSYLGM